MSYKTKSSRRAAVAAKRSITASVVGASLRWTCRRTSASNRSSFIALRIAVSVRSSLEKGVPLLQLSLEWWREAEAIATDLDMLHSDPKPTAQFWDD